MHPPTICRILIYTLNARDALEVNARLARGEISGVSVIEGDEFPMIVTAREQSDDVAVRRSGQVFLNGDGTLWVRNAPGNIGKVNGTWRFPEIAPRPPADLPSQAG